MITPKDKTKLTYLVRLINSIKQPQSGFTLIESIMAVVVLGILLSAIAPMVALSVAARVQARRVDQATQAGRLYTEGVRGGTIAVSNFPTTLLPAALATAPYFNDIPSPNSPGGITLSFPADCNNVDVPGICVDSNSNGFSTSDPQDLVIQPMRTGGTGAANLENLNRRGFDLGVRVYRADAFASAIALYKGSEPECSFSKLTFRSTSGVKQCPLVVMSAEVFPTISGDNFDEIKTRIPTKR
ncbi:MAG: type II secretion system protein [Pseudanabaena sp. CRU_2_10]|nr:type II secretion system protein [Pseudanabaena sp. CRU_2_10]